MNPSKEQIAAYADGELDGDARREVEAALASDATLQAEVDAHRALKARLAAHFAPVADAPVPEHLIRAVARGPVVADFAAASRHRARQARPRLSWFAPALAASLVAALLGYGVLHRSMPAYAAGEVTAALDGQLVEVQQPDAPVRILLSFRNGEGEFCRGFSDASHSGIACRDGRGWRLDKTMDGGAAGTGDYRQAGSADAEVLSAIQDLARGRALDAAGERDAMRAGWRKP